MQTDFVGPDPPRATRYGFVEAEHFMIENTYTIHTQCFQTRSLAFTTTTERCLYAGQGTIGFLAFTNGRCMYAGKGAFRWRFWYQAFQRRILFLGHGVKKKTIRMMAMGTLTAQKILSEINAHCSLQP